jgi:UDP-N-acetylglucosamine 2-epimerase (non-hydrolysing)
MKKYKVLTIVGTRPEIIRLSKVLPKMDQYFDHSLAHTGQNYDYELNEIFFDELGIRRPNYFLNVAGGTAAETVGNVIIQSDRLFEELKPDAVLILGDTNSCMAAISAKRKKIPIFHMEAGNRCFDLRVPEEINRKIVDHIADINLPYSSIAREYLIAEGIPPEMVIKTGSPMFEVLTGYLPKINESDVLSKLKLTNQNYFLISAHREENIDADANFSKLVAIINNLAAKYQLPIIFSAHPRTRKKIEQKGIEFDKLVSIMKPLGFIDYCKLQIQAKAVLSDSGTITEESSILNFPALNIREAHERLEGMEEGAVMMVGLDWRAISSGLDILESQPRGDIRGLRLISDYSMPNVSDKVVRVINSYIDYVNRVIWKK